MDTTVAWTSSTQQVGCLCIVLPLYGFDYHQLAPTFYVALISTCRIKVLDMQDSCNTKSSLHTQCLHLLLELDCACSYYLHSSHCFSFHLWCGYARKQNTNKCYRNVLFVYLQFLNFSLMIFFHFFHLTL